MVRRSGGTSILRATVSAIIKCQGSFFSYLVVRLKSETIVHPLCITNIISYLMWSQNDAKEDDVWNIPIATYFIVTVCTVLLAASMWMNEWKFEPMSENPTLGPSAQVLIKLGAKDTDLIVNDGEYYRLVTAMFLHAGLVHYALNMFGLLAIGRVIELAHGSFALFFLFVIPAIGGTILSAIFLPKSISVGASGGIFGLMGACLADIIIHWTLIFSETINGSGKCCRSFAIFITLVIDVLLNSLIGLTPFVDNFTRKWYPVAKIQLKRTLNDTHNLCAFCFKFRLGRNGLWHLLCISQRRQGEIFS